MVNLPRLNQEEIENMKKPITSTEIENVIKKKKTANKKSRTRLIYQTFKELTTIF